MSMYSDVADKYDTTLMNVERCLRTYIEASYNKKITGSFVATENFASVFPVTA